MKYCSHCGKPLDEGAKFCGKCGSKIAGLGSTNTRVEELPHVQTEKAESSEVLNIAPSNKRLLNYFIDFFGAVGFSVIVGLVLALIGLVDDYTEDSIYTFLGYLSYFSYYLIMESLWRKTIGKMITHTKVVSADGAEVSFGRVLKRTLIRFVPFEVFSFLGQKPVGWHDRWSKTRVVAN